MERCRFGTCEQLVVADGLCIFHMPKEPPTANIAASRIAVRFREDLEQVLGQCIADDSAVMLELDGFVFPELQILDQRLTFSLNFNNAHFVGPVVIRGCLIDGGILFEGAKFDADLQIAATKFARGGVELGKAVFGGNVTFDEVVFQNLTAAAAVFEGTLRMSSCSVLERMVFDRVEFRGSASFFSCEFLGTASFRKAAVAGGFDIDAKSAGGPFYDVFDFSGVVQSDGTRICFIDADLSRATFLNTDLENMRFRNITWDVLDGRCALCDERLLRAADARVWPFAQLQAGCRANYERLAEGYRQLVLNYEKKRDYGTAEDFHIGEMETLRRRQFMSLGYSLYWALSKYGTSYVRAFLMLIAIVAVFASGFLLAGFREVDGSG